LQVDQASRLLVSHLVERRHDVKVCTCYQQSPNRQRPILFVLIYFSDASMAFIAVPIRLLRIGPALVSSMTLMFALDEHLIFGTWVKQPVRPLVNTTLPIWWTRGGLRWRWVLIIFYPVIYLLGTLNLLVPQDQPGATAWYAWALFFSIAHMFFAPTALRRIAAIEKGVPKGDVVVSMEAWLRMNWIRGLTTDLPAWICFVFAALEAL
jgi:hypothetical protein